MCTIIINLQCKSSIPVEIVWTVLKFPVEHKSNINKPVGARRRGQTKHHRTKGRRAARLIEQERGERKEGKQSLRIRCREEHTGWVETEE